MTILTAVLLVRQQSFDSSTLLRSLAYSVGLSVRQAQVYGTSIRESATGAFTAGTAAKAYGLYFSSGSTQSYILFADLNNNGVYNTGEDVQVFTLGNNYRITRFCATTASITPTQRCWTSASPTITNLTILFRRPNPDACFATSLSTNACQAGIVPSESYSSSYVQFVGVQGGTNTRSITVTLTGQVSIGAQGS